MSESNKTELHNESFTLGKGFTCTRIRSDGYHDCGSVNNSLLIHVQNKFLSKNDTCMLSQALIEDAVATTFAERVGHNSTSDTFPQSIELYWDHEKTKMLDENNPLQDMLEPITVSNCLHVLLSRLNRHTLSSTSKKPEFYGLKLIKATDRLKKCLSIAWCHPTHLLVFFSLENREVLTLYPKSLILLMHQYLMCQWKTPQH